MYKDDIQTIYIIDNNISKDLNINSKSKHAGTINKQ